MIISQNIMFEVTLSQKMNCILILVLKQEINSFLKKYVLLIFSWNYFDVSKVNCSVHCFTYLIVLYQLSAPLQMLICFY